MIPAVVPCTDRALWDEHVDRFKGHPQQLWGWGETKAMHGWSVDRVLLNDGDNTVGCAQLLVRRLPFPFRALVYIPRGPMCSVENAPAVLGSLADHAAVRHRGVALSIEPDWDQDSDFAGAVASAGFRATTNTVLIPRTLILDLTWTDDELMAEMSKSTRANIRKAMRSDVEFRKVKNDAELEQVLGIYHETAERAGFGIHEDRYYRDIFKNMGDGSPIIAAFDGEQMLAFVWLARSGSTAFELYGGVSSEGQKTARQLWREVGSPAGHAGRRVRALRLQRPPQRRYLRLQKAVREARKHAPGHLGKTALAVLPRLLAGHAAGPPRTSNGAAPAEGRGRPGPIGA
ncbi:peptidoglycan pentaglycine glycine transferase (the first glycine) [Arthrobacter sp. V1I9]|uniref:lipid II:glycine glycyltransferase FemX n=1 Tax=Arthrobacter sp. V1I9 TaxID=3042275 RepID=UPI002790A9C5|nr:peptidoglycan bridge formation glycyltransferase FemA/FemB family protein [Arthrobacter sp. V1I9]MDQ0869994.1 peptidoglycan pentaglycine glycine transferase (the first glycine) [Arthrobacter sp. V1I9]